MLVAVSPLENNNSRDGRDEMVRFSVGNDFSVDNLLESIDLDDLFVGMEMLPGLEMGEFCLSDSGSTDQKVEDNLTSKREADLGTRKSKTLSQGKRKVKVDWTPELHRRFVQAVEQLGVDKAVPSRILEIMGVACLTRHNIASHLQKYRSHRKHVLAREAEAASWSQRRQMYGATKAVGGGGKREMGPWVAPPPPPTMGFPPITHYRPLHVWGHPSIDRPLMPVWPKQPSTPTWHPHHQRAPYMAQILPQTRFPSAPHHVAVPGIPPPHATYKIDSAARSCPQPPLDLHPSKESIDAAIGDILSQPWQPLPLGLKPPALDSVMVELQKQGIQKIPPTCI